MSGASFALLALFASCASLPSWKVAFVSPPLMRPPVPDGLSGVTRRPDGRFLSVEDSGGRLWTLGVAFDVTNGAPTSCTVDGPVVLAGVVDGEGCAWDPLRQTIWVSDETGPHVAEFDPRTGKRLGELALTDDFRRIRPNRGPEGLTISPDGLTLWTCPEEAVDGDGPLASPTNATLVRLHRYVRASGRETWRHASEHLYRADPFGGVPYRDVSSSGVSGLCALADGALLVLERELSVKDSFPSFRLRLYEFRADRPKRLLLDLDTGLEMYEGVCLAGQNDDGSLDLLLVSDGDGIPLETLRTVRLVRETP